MSKQSERFSVVIIGAGVAALEAASTLRKLGVKDFVVLEANNYIGGRVISTKHFQPVRDIEIGAELLHGVNHLMDQYTADIPGVQRVFAFDLEEGNDKDRRYLFYSKNKGKIYHVQDKRGQKLMAGIDSMFEGEIKDRSVLEHLQEAFKNDEDPKELADLVESYVCATNGSILSRVGIAGMYQEDAAATNGSENYLYTNAYSTHLLNTLIKQIGKEKIRTSSPVTAVVDAQKHIEIFCKGSDAPILCDRVICTVPITMLRRTPREEHIAHEQLSFKPALPAEKMHALNKQLVIEGGLKVTVQLSKDVFHCIPYFKNIALFFIADDLISQCWFPPVVKSDKCIVTGFATGARIDEFSKKYPNDKQAEEVIIKHFLQFLDKLQETMLGKQKEFDAKQVPAKPLPKPSSIYEKGILHNWTTAPYVRGAYSCSGVGSIGARDVLAQPCWNNRVMFAGEATTADGCGTVHGALHSGRRAAFEVLREMQNTPLSKL